MYPVDDNKYHMSHGVNPIFMGCLFAPIYALEWATCVRATHAHVCLHRFLHHMRKSGMEMGVKTRVIFTQNFTHMRP